MGAKLKSKTHLQNTFFDFLSRFLPHLQNTFFDFLSRFLRICSQSSQKVQVWPKKIVLKNRKRCQKTQNFTLISNPLKKLEKNAHKKSYKQNKFDKHE
jgi:hypothetical protein